MATLFGIKKARDLVAALSQDERDAGDDWTYTVEPIVPGPMAQADVPVTRAKVGVYDGAGEFLGYMGDNWNPTDPAPEAPGGKVKNAGINPFDTRSVDAARAAVAEKDFLPATETIVVGKTRVSFARKGRS